MRSRYKKYVDGFLKEKDEEYIKHINLKNYHTKKVCKEIFALGIDQEELAFAEVIA